MERSEQSSEQVQSRKERHGNVYDTVHSVCVPSPLFLYLHSSSLAKPLVEESALRAPLRIVVQHNSSRGPSISIQPSSQPFTPLWPAIPRLLLHRALKGTFSLPLLRSPPLFLFKQPTVPSAGLFILPVLPFLPVRVEFNHDLAALHECNGERYRGGH